MSRNTLIMEDRQWTYVDKTKWKSGEWSNEPDKMQWVDEKTGLPCLIVRGPIGALCGYVGVDPKHPWFGKGYGDKICKCKDEFCYKHRPDSKIQVHGGLTYSDHCQEEKVNYVCHVTENDDERWWFGFDCAHWMDEMPGMPIIPGYESKKFGGGYRNIAYVKNECASLAGQLVKIKK